MIQYPSGKKRKNSAENKSNTANRGMRLEEDINISNTHYNTHNLAVVHKKPTPVQVVHVDYPARNRAKITEAYYKQASTTDYNGVFNGHAIDFEAKETKNKSSFPLSSLHDHQIEHLKAVINHDAIAFLIIRFAVHDETYLVYAQDIITYIESNTRKSIPLVWIKEMGHLIEYQYRIPCDYLSVIKKHLKRRNYEKEKKSSR